MGLARVHYWGRERNWEINPARVVLADLPLGLPMADHARVDVREPVQAADTEDGAAGLGRGPEEAESGEPVVGHGGEVDRAAAARVEEEEGALVGSGHEDPAVAGAAYLGAVEVGEGSLEGGAVAAVCACGGGSA
ncbi:hypothetical protein STAS_14077 [Striga asiatica]|uniref:Uncharacterized protein n=1 Tax=Striga asiatica TaxID=4170 RepID=A0A5A7PY15_STRAF|nr:hypothetical protein STAS_14077 [Striga asiatica]